MIFNISPANFQMPSCSAPPWKEWLWNNSPSSEPLERCSCGLWSRRHQVKPLQHQHQLKQWKLKLFKYKKFILPSSWRLNFFWFLLWTCCHGSEGTPISEMEGRDQFFRALCLQELLLKHLLTWWNAWISLEDPPVLRMTVVSRAMRWGCRCWGMNDLVMTV